MARLAKHTIAVSHSVSTTILLLVLVVAGPVRAMVDSDAVDAALRITGNSGSIRITVLNTDSEPLPAATVSLYASGNHLVRRDQSGTDGTVLFHYIPPDRYQVTVTYPGKITRKNSHLWVYTDSLSTAVFRLRNRPSVNTLQCPPWNTDCSPGLSLTGAMFTCDLMDRLPGSSDMYRITRFIPGVSPSGPDMVFGSDITGNRFSVDDSHGSDAYDNGSVLLFPAGSLETLLLQTHSFTAEHGQVSGGLYQAYSTAPRNTYAGTFLLTYMEWDWESAHDPFWQRTSSGDNYWIPSLNISGPIMKDRLWFQAAYQGSVHRRELTLARRFQPAANSAARDISDPLEESSFHIKLIGRLSVYHQLSAEFGGYSRDGRRDPSEPADKLPHEISGRALEEALVRRRAEYPYAKLEWIWTPLTDLTIRAAVGAASSRQMEEPSKKEIYDPQASPFFGIRQELFYNNSPEWSQDMKTRQFFTGDLVYKVNDYAGNHVIKTGIELEELARSFKNQFPGGAVYQIVLNEQGHPENPDYYTGSTAVRYILPEAGTADSWAHYLGVYTQDEWIPLQNIRFNIGLRYEFIGYENHDRETRMPAWEWGEFAAEDYRDADGYHRDLKALRFNDMLAPRISLTWDMYGDSERLIKAFFGRYYHPLPLAYVDGFQPTDARNTLPFRQDYIGPGFVDMDRDGIPDDPGFFDDGNWTEYDHQWIPARYFLDKELETEYTDELSLGYHHLISPDLSLDIAYVHRETNDRIETAGLFLDADGNVVWTYLGGITDGEIDPEKRYDPRPVRDYQELVYLITNADGNRLRYDGVTVSLTGRYRFLDLLAAYTYSNNRGKTQREYPGEGLVFFSHHFDTVALSRNLDGPIDGTSDHVVQVSGAFHYRLSDWYEFSLGFQGFWSHAPYYTTRQFPPLTFDPDNPDNDPSDPSTWTYLPPYAASREYFYESRGNRRLPDLYRIDLSIQNTFFWGKWGRSTVILDIYNATDNQDPVAAAYNRIWSSEPEFRFQEPRRWQVSFRYRF